MTKKSSLLLFVKRKLRILLATVLVLSSFSASAALANPMRPSESRQPQVSESLQSKYSYFLKNNTVVISAILVTKCKAPYGYSYKIRESAEIWVSQTKKHTQNGVSMYPTIAYRKATSSKGKFVLTAAGESKLWWTKKWGCPVVGTWNTYGTQVSMTTQELINAGY